MQGTTRERDFARLRLHAQLQEHRVEDESATDAQQPSREAGKRHHTHNLGQPLVSVRLACTPGMARLSESGEVIPVWQE